MGQLFLGSFLESTGLASQVTQLPAMKTRPGAEPAPALSDGIRLPQRAPPVLGKIKTLLSHENKESRLKLYV